MFELMEFFNSKENYKVYNMIKIKTPKPNEA